VAQDQGTPAEQQACEPDVNRLCHDAGSDRDKVIVCLNQKVRQLSPACRTVILFYTQEKICGRDASRLCSGVVQDREQLFACMSHKTRSLSPSCRQAFMVYARERH
jgi:hypothetical protein